MWKTREFWLVALLLVLPAGCGKEPPSVQKSQRRAKATPLLAPESSTHKDGWQTAEPASLGFEVGELKEILRAADELNSLYALVVVRDGKIVVDAYFNRATIDTLLHVRSITKNVTSALTGIALRDGQLKDKNVRLGECFPELRDDPKAAITVQHLLNMTTGIEWDEQKEIYALVLNQVEQPIDYLFSKPMSKRPGEKMRYNSVATHVLSSILEQKAGKPLEDLAREKLFQPLGIEKFQWEKDPEGKTWGGYGLQLRARDLARFGQLYLQTGLWNGRQVVPEAWVRESSESQVDTGVEGGGYSNLWWYADIEPYDEPVYYGMGYGGQGLAIAPDKSLVIVGLQEHNVPPQSATRQWNDFVERVAQPIYRAARKQ